jgi:cyclopropane fatty-acyl-phospholipid synthase-like methyltransferase
VGKPQSALVELIEKYPPADPVLDIGCGSGDLAIFLAERGRQVIGVDIVEGAIRQAREKAGDLPKKVRRNLTFREADLFGPTSPSGPYAAVVDSGFYHLFDEGEVEPFLDRLSELLAPAGHYYLLAFASTFDISNVPRAVSEAELRSNFSLERGWAIEEIADAQFESSFAPVPAIRACLRRVAGGWESD